MPVENTSGAAEAEVLRRFQERTEAFLVDLEEAHNNALPGNHSPAEAILLAHLMTATDGYSYVNLAREWCHRRKSGWGTTVIYLAVLDCGTLVRFALETRYEQHTRQLAVLVDENRPGERLPRKADYERRLVSLGFRVMQFTELEILSNSEACRERVEQVLSEMSDDVLEDAGLLHPWHRRKNDGG